MCSQSEDRDFISSGRNVGASETSLCAIYAGKPLDVTDTLDSRFVPQSLIVVFIVYHRCFSDSRVPTSPHVVKPSGYTQKQIIGIMVEISDTRATPT